MNVMPFESSANRRCGARLLASPCNVGALPRAIPPRRESSQHCRASGRVGLSCTLPSIALLFILNGMISRYLLIARPVFA